ncbi:hypothetical protein GCM10028807_39080 [Spirosoma daeguense]
MITLGQRILGYTLQEVIGEGGMATIYRATNPLGKQKAIKVLKPEFTSDPHVRQRFEQEAQIMVKLGEHTIHICQVDDLEVTPHYVALVMEYLQGENLATFLRINGPISPQQLIAWMEPVLLAVGYAHKQDVVHRDIKPANLYLTTQGQIKVLDFGIAKVLSSGEDLTFTQQMIGSPRYMSPEQILTPKQVDHRSDIYSLGVTMWALLTGHRPFSGESGNESDFMIQTRIVNQLLPPLEGRLALLNPVIQQATAKAIDNRYQNCQLLSEALINALKTPLRQVAPPIHSEEDKTQVLKRPSSVPVSTPIVQIIAEPDKTPGKSPPPTVEIPLEPAFSGPPPTIQFSLEPVPGATLPEDNAIENRPTSIKRVIYGLLLALVLLVGGYFLWATYGPEKETIVPFTENGKYGIKNSISGNFIFTPQFVWADSLRDNVMLIELKPDTYRVLGADGQWRSDTIKGLVESFSEELAVVSNTLGKSGFIDKLGKLVIDFQFDKAESFSNGLALVRKGNQWAYIDKSGKTVIDATFDYATLFSDGLALVKKAGKWVYIDPSGQPIINVAFDIDTSVASSYTFHEGLALTEQNGKYGYIDKTGNIVIDIQFLEAYPFSEGLALVLKEHQWGFIDHKGKTAIEFQYEFARSFSEGLAAVRKNGKYGYINQTGTPVIDFQFDSDLSFKEGLAPVRKNGKYGYVDQTGKTIIGYQFDKASGFSRNRAQVSKGDTTLRIDRAGHVLERQLRSGI